MKRFVILLALLLLSTSLVLAQDQPTLVVIPGTIQSVLGCPGDWQPECEATALTLDTDTGLWSATFDIPAGSYEYKVALDGAWTVNYGLDGEPSGANIPLELAEDSSVEFVFDPVAHTVTHSVNGAVVIAPVAETPAEPEPQPDMVVVPGTIQSVLGCSADWQTDCAASALTYDADDDLWQATFDLPAGDYEYKVALNGTWDVNYGLNALPGGANIPLSLAEDTSVKFIYSNTTHWVTDSVNSLIANVPGSFQSEIGCPGDWAPDCLRTLLQDPDGDGVYVYATSTIPPGAYEAKVALNESWDLNYGAEGAPGGANIAFTVAEEGTLTEFSFDTSTNILSIDTGGAAVGSLFTSLAQWVTADTIAWNIAPQDGATYRLYYSFEGGMELAADGIGGGTSIELTLNPEGLSAAVLAKFPHLADYTALSIAESDLGAVPGILRMQFALAAISSDGRLLDATGIQIPGVLDDLYTYDGALGVTWADDIPTLSVWAPTAQRVRVRLYDDATIEDSTRHNLTFDANTGVWSVTGEADWKNKYYLYEVVVYAPSTQAIETNLVTDPYSFSLSTNSQRSQIVDLNDPALTPEGWSEYAKPELDAFEDIVLYELHVRDFSIYDETVPEALRGTFLAFSQTESNGMQHLSALADAGLTHVHLLPAFDLATINENSAERSEIDRAELAALPPDSEDQQALIGPVRGEDGFNWGYDPLHYTVPEGSYSTDPNGAQRILEFRQMVMALNEAGLRVVMDVVYNHTNAAGQSANAVLDRIVPGYYHRLNAAGNVESSTCCSNTATEHAMMEKLMIDSLITWSTMYKVDGYRFDLMGHHMVENMVHVREALDSLTVDANGVDGSDIYVYGEGWDFGEVAQNARGVNATQLNLGGTGIGTFNDRVRDSLRGGSPFGGLQEQGFINGLYTDPSEDEIRDPDTQLDLLLLFQDRIRVALAGNLRDYTFENYEGTVVTGADVDYNGSPTGYTLDPQEHIVYTAAHDNEALFDIIQVKAPLATSLEDRVRMNNLALDVVMLAQGVPFFHAGDEMLRSKSGDKNSYDSGDWYNALDFSYQDNGWGHGLPPAWTTQENWAQWQPLLANPDLQPTSANIQSAISHFEEMLSIRRDVALFRLRTGADVVNSVTFQNTGVDQVPGLIVMSISDQGETNLDPTYSYVVVLFNASPETQTFTLADVTNIPLQLHAVQAASSDPITASSAFDSATGTFTVPARTTAVFIALEGELP